MRNPSNRPSSLLSWTCLLNPKHCAWNSMAASRLMGSSYQSSPQAECSHDFPKRIIRNREHAAYRRGKQGEMRPNRSILRFLALIPSCLHRSPESRENCFFWSALRQDINGWIPGGEIGHLPVYITPQKKEGGYCWSGEQ